MKTVNNETSYVSKSNLSFILLLCISLFFDNPLFAQAVGDYRSSVNNGNWGTRGNWQRWDGGAWVAPTAGQGWPGQNSSPTTVTIRNGFNIILNTNVTNAIGNLVVGDGSGGNLETDNTARTINVTTALTVNAGSTLGLEAMTITNNGTTNVYGTLTDISATGANVFVGAFTVYNGGSFSLTSNETCEFRGGITNDGTFSKTGTGTSTFSTNNQIIGGSGAITMNGVVTVTGVIVTNNSTNLSLSSTAASSITGTGTWRQGTSSVLNTQAASINITTFDCSTNTNTVNFNRNGAQTIPAITYHHLTASAGNTKTAAGNFTVNGDLTISAGTLDLGTVATTVSISGNAVITGTFSFNGTSTKTVNINGNLSGAGTINISGGSLLHTLNLGGATNAITTFTTAAVASTVNYNRSGDQTVFASANYRNLTTLGSGVKTLQGNATIGGNLTVSAGTFDFGATARTVSVTGNLSGAGIIDMSGGSALHTLNLGGATNAISTFTTAAVASTINYNRAGDQTVFASANYRNLTISGSGVKALQGNSSVGGNLSVSAGTLDLGTVVTSLDVSGTAAIAGILLFNGTATKTVSITGALSGAGTINMSGGSLLHTLNLGGATNAITTFTTNTGSIVNYNRAGDQTVFTSLNYRNLTISGSGTKTLQGNSNINDNLTVSAGTFSLGTVPTAVTVSGTAAIAGTLSFGATATKTLNIGGALSGAGTIDMSGGSLLHILNLGAASNDLGTLTTAAVASAVNYVRAGDQTVFASANYRNLGISGSGVKTLEDNSTVGGILNVSAGTFGLGTVATTLNVGGAATLAGIFNFDGTTTKTVSITGNLSGAGTINMSGGSLLHTLNLGGATNTITTFTTAAVASTVNYNRAGDQTMFASLNYRNLTISGGTGFKSIGGVTTVNNDLNINSGALLDVVASNFTVNGSSTIAGNLQDNNAASGTTSLQNVDLSGGTINGTQSGVLNINGNLTMPTGNGIIGRVVLTVTGTTTIAASRSLTLNDNNGIKIFNGEVDVDGTFSSTAVTTVGNLVFRNGVSNNNASGTFSTNVATFNTNNQSISGLGAFNFAGAVTITGAITVTNQCSHSNGVTIVGTLNGSVAGSTYVNDANAVTQYQSATQPMGTGVLTATASNNNFKYNGGLAQAVKTTTYNKLTIGGGGSFVKSTSAAIIVNNDLSIEGSSVLNPGANNFTVTDSSIIQGTFNDNNSTGTNSFGHLQISGTGSFLSSGTSSLIFTAGINNAGTINQSAAGTVTFNTNNQLISGSGSITFAGIVTVTGFTLTNEGTNVNFTNTGANTLTGTGGFTQGSGSVLNFSGQSMNIATSNFSSNDNTINFNYAGGNIALPSGSYDNFTITGAVTKSLSGATDVNGNLTISSGTLDVTAFNHSLNVEGNWNNSGGTFVARNGTVTLNGNAAQSITANSQSFYNLTFNNSAAGASAITLNDNVTVSNTLTLTDGIINTGANRIIMSSTSAASLSGGSAASYINGNLRRNIASNTSTYIFPVGGSAYQEASVKNNSLTGVTYIDASFGALANHDDADMNVNDSIYGVNKLYYATISTDGTWVIEPNSQPSGGSYDMYLSIANISGLSSNEFAILKRPVGSLSAASWSTGNGAISAGNGDGRKLSDGYALRTGLTSFSEFGIGSTQSGNPLPIVLISFDAKVVNKKVELNWATGTEINNDFFTIERSQNGVDFEAVLTADGAGNSSQVLTYAAIDENPLNGVSYYRLKQTDFDGAFEYSKIISISMGKQTNSVYTVYPNPAVKGSTLNISAAQPVLGGKTVVEIFNATKGEKVAEQEMVEQLLPISLPYNLSSGIYLINITSGDKTQQQKIIVQ